MLKTKAQVLSTSLVSCLKLIFENSAVISLKLVRLINSKSDRAILVLGLVVCDLLTHVNDLRTNIKSRTSYDYQ